MAPCRIAVPYLVFAVAVAVAVLGCAFPIRAQVKAKPAASEQDEQIRTWIAQLGDPKRGPEAARRLERAGEKIVKPLMKAITGDGIEDDPRTRRAIELVIRMGPDARAAYPVLADQVARVDPNMFLLVWQALADLAPFSEAQGDSREAQRLIQNGMNNLNGMPAQDRRQWSSEYTRLSRRIMVDPKLDVAGLQKLVARNQIHQRDVAVVVLGRMGKRAKPALATIAKSLRTAIGRSRSRPASVSSGSKGVVTRSSRLVQTDEFPAHAADAMIRIAPRDPLCSIAYGWRLLHGATDVDRAAAALRIGSSGERAAAEVPTLQQGLADQSPRVRWEVITALGMIGPPAKAAVKDLTKILAGEDKAAAARARAALRQITPK